MALGRWILLSSVALVAACSNNALSEAAKKPLASGASVARVVFAQGVSVDVVVDNAFPPYRSAPIIQGKHTLVRVFVDVDASWTSREIVAVLGVKDEGAEAVEVFESTLLVNGSSTEPSMASTFNFDLPADLLTLNSTYSVSFHEVSRKAGGSGSKEKARFPVEGFASLAVQPANEIEIVLLPFRYNADGSGRVPDTSQPTLDVIQQRVSEMYPASKVNLTVAPTQAWLRTVSANGRGWSELLNEVAYQRSTADVPENTYYYAYFQPANSFDEYCSRGCVLGMSSLGAIEDTWSRASMGVAFGGEMALETANTIAHEVGHAHGREHAPCGLGGQEPDPAFPYLDGTIGLWGYEQATAELKDPSQVYDVMSYCNPVWISDYTYRGLYERINTLAAVASYRAPDGFEPSWRTVLVNQDGDQAVGRSFSLRRPPGGEVQSVDIIDANGVILATERAYFYSYTHVDGGFWLLPDSAPKGELRLTSY